MNQYKDFTEEDFIKDQSFRKWIMDPENEKANIFWDSFIARYPHKKEEIDRAGKFILLMKFKENPVSDKEINLLKNRIEGSISYPVILPYDQTLQNTRRKSYGIKYAVAAALILFVISIGVLVFLNGTGVETESPSAESLTKKVEHISKKGKRSMIILEDGTKVWLNAESKISYAQNFNDLSRREVFLQGEAFFDVAKNPDKPFIVHTSSLAIRVTGTSFNVRSYERDEYVETTLLEGRVIIELNEEANAGMTPPIETALLPNQQARYDKKSGKIELENRVKAEEYSEWRSGKLYFEERPITEVISMLERWYNVEIHLEDVPPPTCLFSAKLDNMTLEEVLELFKISDAISYQVSENEVIISGELCRE